MNLGNYISGYLDGDLTPEQDAELRAIISDDPSAREEFEHAALLGATMMSDAENIVVPDDLFNDTEALIVGLMHEEQQKKAAMLMRPARQRFYRAAAAAMFALLYFIADSAHIFNGSDGRNVSFLPSAVVPSPIVPSPIFQSSNLNGGKEYPVLVRRHNSQPVEEVTPLISVTSDSKTVAVITPQQSQSDDPNLAPISKSVPISTQFLLPTMPMFSSSTDANAGNSIPAFASVTPIPSTSAYSEIGATPSNAIARTVQMGTFVGNVVSGSANNKFGTQHYSQSLGYSVSPRDNVGFEVGFIAYNGTIGSVGLSPTATSAGINRGGIEGSPENSADSASNVSGARWSEHSDTQERNVFWGAAYYERSLLSHDILQFNTRLGVGASAEGPILFGRGFARVKIYGNFSLTAGAEGRMFIMTSEGKQSAADNIQTVLSTVYGVQVRF